ncbi:zinc-binding oxidoreductase CipB [Thozetella sp. PMI_491]|nr:zinc-binding oxidoreductase CipB [Thozetella sp. PMI_491]
MASNTAAWLPSEKAYPFEVKAAPMGTPGENQILVKNHALAINPINFKLQALAIYPMQYPVILGEDVAGEVVAVGPGVTRFREGDRVAGVAAGFVTKQNQERGFQAYTVLETDLTSDIPNGISFEAAAVLPLCCATAASGLFNPQMLHLDVPTEPARAPNGKTVLVWGGASSVGCNAIQLAVAAGYEVLTTASPKNFARVKQLGASVVFDYNSPTVAADLVAAAQGKTLVGVLDCVGGQAWAPCFEFLQKTDGVKFIVTTIPRFPDPPEGITIMQTQALATRDSHVAKAVFEDFLPKALRSGAFVPAPDPLVVGKGLESIQAAVDLYRKGLSAQKAVVTL